MAKVNFSEGLAQEYRTLYKTCITNPDRFDAVNGLVDTLLAHRIGYTHL